MPSGSSTHHLHPQRKIRLIRHGNAKPNRFGQADFSRPLDQCGLNDLRNTTQQLLSRKANTADWLWASSAARTVTTARALSSICNCPMQLEEDLYLAGPESILSVLQSTPEDFHNMILVGHNPGISMLAGLLNNPALTIELGTLGIVELTFEGQWQDLNFGQCQHQATYDYKTMVKPTNNN